MHCTPTAVNLAVDAFIGSDIVLKISTSKSELAVNFESDEPVMQCARVSSHLWQLFILIGQTVDGVAKNLLHQLLLFIWRCKKRERHKTEGITLVCVIYSSLYPALGNRYFITQYT